MNSPTIPTHEAPENFNALREDPDSSPTALVTPLTDKSPARYELVSTVVNASGVKLVVANGNSESGYSLVCASDQTIAIFDAAPVAIARAGIANGNGIKIFVSINTGLDALSLEDDDYEVTMDFAGLASDEDAMKIAQEMQKIFAEDSECDCCDGTCDDTCLEDEPEDWYEDCIPPFEPGHLLVDFVVSGQTVSDRSGISFCETSVNALYYLIGKYSLSFAGGIGNLATKAAFCNNNIDISGGWMDWDDATFEPAKDELAGLSSDPDARVILEAIRQAEEVCEEHQQQRVADMTSFARGDRTKELAVPDETLKVEVYQAINEVTDLKGVSLDEAYEYVQSLLKQLTYYVAGEDVDNAVIAQALYTENKDGTYDTRLFETAYDGPCMLAVRLHDLDNAEPDTFWVNADPMVIFSKALKPTWADVAIFMNRAIATAKDTSHRYLDTITPTGDMVTHSQIVELFAGS